MMMEMMSLMQWLRAPGDKPDDLLNAMEAGPSSQSPESFLAAYNAAVAEDGNEPPRWKTRGILNTVKGDDIDEINRLRGLVDTRLHEAAQAQDLRGLRALLDEGASPAALDWEGRTPLHLCVALKLMGPFKVLLTAPGAADVRDASGWPLLHATLVLRWRDGTHAALDAGARVDATGTAKIDMLDLWPYHYKEHRYQDLALPKILDSLPRTAIEVAMTNDMEMLDPILTVAKENGILECRNLMGNTALHTAIWLHKIPAVETLLLYGASPHKLSNKDDSALHVAVLHPDILAYFLRNTDLQSTLNKEGFAPEHEAIRRSCLMSLRLLLDKFKNTRVKTGVEGNTPLHLAAIMPGDEAAKIILEPRQGKDLMFDVNTEGCTPLHEAAKNHNKEVAALLLLNGADLSTQTKDENPTTVLELISTNFYEAEIFFERLFDGSIYNSDITGKICVNVDYEMLGNGEDMSQIKFMEEIVKCGRSEVLIHPLIESLLYLKWKHFQPLFFALLCFYGIFLVFFNSLVVCIFYLNDRVNNTSDTNNSVNASTTSDAEVAYSNRFDGAWYWVLIVFTYISILTLLLQESMFIYMKRLSHFKTVESWVKLIGLVLCAATPPLAALAPDPWPRHIACAALILAWLQAMFLVSRFSRWGYYVLMFWKVAVNILKILVTAVFLVIAFAFSFMIQYHSSPPFDDPFAAFVKTLVMMSSEFEYENLFNENHDAHLQDTRVIVRLLFVMFVIFVAIVLMNFMIGVAVSDINDLNTTGQIRRLEKQVELLSTFEPLAYDGFLSKWFLKLFGDKRYHISMNTFRGNKSEWHVKIRVDPKKKFESSEKEYTIQIRSSKLYKAVVETPSKQQKQDQEAAKNNGERPYRSQINAVNYEVTNRREGVRGRGEDDDLVMRRENRFDSIIFKSHLHDLVKNSSQMSRDIEVLKERNEVLNLQLGNLSTMSSDILRSLKLGPNTNWTSLARKTARPRRRARRSRRKSRSRSRSPALNMEQLNELIQIQRAIFS